MGGGYIYIAYPTDMNTALLNVQEPLGHPLRCQSDCCGHYFRNARVGVKSRTLAVRKDINLYLSSVQLVRGKGTASKPWLGQVVSTEDGSAYKNKGKAGTKEEQEEQEQDKYIIGF